jgi:hypothetical protein
LKPVTLQALAPNLMGEILALIPVGDYPALADMAAKVVMGLDAFRRPPSVEELARRRQRRLSPVQEDNLAKWGYPFVMEAFRFHITLTGRIAADREQVLGQATRYFAPHLEQPVEIDSLTLAGQDNVGMFHEINRFALMG